MKTIDLDREQGNNLDTPAGKGRHLKSSEFLLGSCRRDADQELRFYDRSLEGNRYFALQIYERSGTWWKPLPTKLVSVRLSELPKLEAALAKFSLSSTADESER